MRIHRLEISGFKSFPDRSELLFDRGVTAIVGPNGCGKSNVVDAITWVLGEQSAKSLRGDRMEDVIFSGSEARRPTAAAEVRLFLAGVTASARYGSGTGSGGHGNGHGNGNGGHAVHVDGEPAGAPEAPVGILALADPEEEMDPIAREVQVSRRLYRSGESEYLIDGQVCRLRDVQDLLMDAGLGVKGYAVIEQGKIGQILSAKPTDRRQLIEEAAGVTKYKSRRRAAELKLEAAQQNLLRVDDIVFEVEKQRGALRRQAARARRYRRLRDELRRWEKIAFARRYRALAANIESLRGRMEESRTAEIAAAAHLGELEASLEQRRIELAEADNRAASARQTAHALELEMGRRQQQIELDRQQVELLGHAAEGLRAEIETLERRIGPAREEEQRTRESAARAAEMVAHAMAALEAAETAFIQAHQRIEGLEADVEAARSEVFAALNAATALRHAIEHAAVARERLGGTLEKLDLERSELGAEAEKVARDQAATTEDLRTSRAALDSIVEARAGHDAALARARQEREVHARSLKTLEHELTTATARLRSLEDLDGSRAGYGDAARLVLADPQQTIHHQGSVADHLEVEQRYERAVEGCLGDLLQHVIVDTRVEAELALEYVRERNAGRCGFVVADGATEPIAARSDLSEGLASILDVVRIDGPAAAAIRAAVGNAVIADSFEAATLAAGRESDLVATLDGVVFRGRHVLEGGSRNEALGILAIKREIKELRDRVQAGGGMLNQEVARATEFDLMVTRLEEGIVGLIDRQHDHEKSILSLELQQARTSDEAVRVERKQELVEVERRTAEEERAALGAREAEAREAVANLEEEQHAADERLSAAQRRLFEARELEADRSREVAEGKASHAALVERASAHAEQLARLAEALQDLDTRLATRRSDLDQNEERRNTLSRAIAEGESRLDADLRALDELKESVRLAEVQVSELHALVQTREGGIRDARRALETVRAELSELGLAHATAQADLSHLESACVETLDTPLDQVIQEAAGLETETLTVAQAPADESDLEEEAAMTAGEDASSAEGQPPAQDAAAPLTPETAIAQLRDKINRLGPVNMMAIEQFDELEERHQFLTVQRKDLVDSIAATGEAIRRIDKTTRERFKDAFTVINEHFQVTFTTLFGGGRAGLVLLDEADVLESGIDIIAQPPGKRLQNVTLLSGGEKALTAMALMFAIFRYRPSPFCLLDEIDAPLDDANIGRFIEMLQAMQTETQFVLITHNRKTMEIADRLYGVTMEEPGVSKLISVRLN